MHLSFIYETLLTHGMKVLCEDNIFNRYFNTRRKKYQ